MRSLLCTLEPMEGFETKDFTPEPNIEIVLSAPWSSQPPAVITTHQGIKLVIIA